jgi:hypothetical protein
VLIDIQAVLISAYLDCGFRETGKLYPAGASVPVAGEVTATGGPWIVVVSAAGIN